VRGYVGVTDGDWYRFLAERPEVASREVNFWRPGGGNAFRALEVGEPFFFKTHAPHNRVVGGGFFSGFAPLRASEAWAMLKEGNGVASLEQMRERIAHYRREPIGPREDPEIGCVFIRDSTFFPDDLTFDPPPGFKLNIVQGKGYEMGDLLALPADTTTVLRSRRFVLDGKPVLLSRSWLPASIAAGTAIAEPDTGPGGTYARLADLGHAPARFREDLRSRMPNSDEAERLEIVPGTPVIDIIRVAVDANGATVEVNEMTADASAYVFRYEFSA
jgi:UTRA domain